MAEKKLKKLSKKTSSSTSSTAKTVMESANQIWLAGLGAFAKAQEEGGKIFDSLVKEGREMEGRTRKATEERVSEVRGAFDGTVSQVQARATESWDKLEKVFEDRVARALNTLGVPTSKDVQELTRRVEQLQKAVDEYNRKASAPATSGAAKGTVKAETPIKPVKKTTAAGSKKTVGKKTTVKKA